VSNIIDHLAPHTHNHLATYIHLMIECMRHQVITLTAALRRATCRRRTGSPSARPFTHVTNLPANDTSFNFNLNRPGGDGRW
jgi:hypothetical protein